MNNRENEAQTDQRGKKISHGGDVYYMCPGPITASSMLLRRGPYVIAAGLGESDDASTKVIHGEFIDLFDPELALAETVSLSPQSLKVWPRWQI